MLNLYVRLLMSLKLQLFLLFALLTIAAQTTPPIAITSPTSGAFLRGSVTITGTATADNFLSAQLDFGYASDSTGSWFTLQTFSQPLQDSTLATWDTTSITDGDYILRLRVNLGDGTSQEVIVPIRIQNDTPIVTPTVTALPPTATAEEIT